MKLTLFSTNNMLKDILKYGEKKNSFCLIHRFFLYLLTQNTNFAMQITKANKLFNGIFCLILF